MFFFSILILPPAQTFRGICPHGRSRFRKGLPILLLADTLLRSCSRHSPAGLLSALQPINTTNSYYKTRILFFQFFTAKKRLKIYMYTMREAMSHARTKMLTTAVSSLTSGWRHFRTYTANAATVSERHAFANLVGSTPSCVHELRHGKSRAMHGRENRELPACSHAGRTMFSWTYLTCFYGSRSAATPIRPGPVLSARVAAICLP